MTLRFTHRGAVTIGHVKRPDPAPSNVEWRRWGRVDPFFGVATWEGRQRGGANPWTAADFYALGRSDWGDYRERWVRYGVDFGRVVEIGCGAGRLTRFMAADFASVVGIDVSDGMLKVAQANIDASNVDLRLGDGVTLPVESGSADGVFSTHVFQHFESFALARANFSEVARVLRPGGTMMVHLPITVLPVGLPGISFAVNAKRRLGDLRAKVRRRQGKPFMRGLQYPWEWITGELPALGLVDVEFAIFATVSNGQFQPCVLARRAGVADSA